MASIRPPRTLKDGSKIWVVNFRIDGRQSSTSWDNENAAEAFKAAVNAHGAARACELYRINPNPRSRTASGMTVAQWIRHHIDHLTGLDDYTIYKYNSFLENDIAPLLGQIPLDELSEEDISRWVKNLEETPTKRGGKISAKTLRNKYGFLSGALNAAVPKRIPSNPAAGRKLKRAGGDEDDDHDIQMLTHEQFDRLQNSTTEYWREFQEFLVASGCRWSEATALQPAEHIDKRKGTVKIRQAWKYSPGKGYYLGPPKTKRSRREIDVPDHILSRVDFSSEWMFVNRDGGPIRYHGYKRRVWDKAVGRSELNPKPTPHDLRHTCASWLLLAGVPITVVSRHLGHENIQITVDTYGDVDRASSRAVAAFMSKTLR
ncbi:site-specific recombinase XerD [Mycobacteroides abscessus subsp. bolletii]|uniref:tyrosine-type recombinase/integrase n=1 Tax=Mycobacteroides abscessus TaxID=36809 RepID=UPI0009A5AE0C|nr:site-specific integrase [Mycobacteroides abscessus]SLF47205.1 site-specific recombinase XerD [Mycobacteroides abscessus subsp. bolletii]